VNDAAKFSVATGTFDAVVQYFELSWLLFFGATW